MNDLLDLVVKAHGGLDQWRQFYTVSAHLVVGGDLWAMKGHDGVIDEVDVKVNLLEQKVSHKPGDAWHTHYTPDRVLIEDADGNIIEEMYNPRSSFKDHVWETRWTSLQLAYFTGYATWNYINTPFQFTRPGFAVSEIEPWIDNDEKWRRLKVVWPKDVHTHSKEQILYIDDEGLIMRLDYRVEVAGNGLCAHYLSDYKEVSGIKIATKREVYQMGDDNKPKLDAPVIVTIDINDIVFK